MESKKNSLLEVLDSKCNPFTQLDSNLINRIGSYLGSSKDILHLTECNKEMLLLFQDAFLASSFGFVDRDHIRKVVQKIQKKNKINSLHFSNCRGLNSDILLEIVREVNVNNNENKQQQLILNKLNDCHLNNTFSTYSRIEHPYKLSSLYVEKCYSVRDDLLYYLEREESLSLDALHLCDLNNIKLSMSDPKSPSSSSSSPSPLSSSSSCTSSLPSSATTTSSSSSTTISSLKILGLNNSVFASSPSFNSSTVTRTGTGTGTGAGNENKNIFFSNILLHEIVEGHFPLLEALFIGGCQKIKLLDRDLIFLPLLNQHWKEIVIDNDNERKMSSMTSRARQKLCVSPNLRLIEHSFVEEETINNFVSLIRVSQQVEKDIVCRRDKEYKGMETLWEYFHLWNTYTNQHQHQQDQTTDEIFGQDSLSYFSDRQTRIDYNTDSTERVDLRQGKGKEKDINFKGLTNNTTKSQQGSNFLSPPYVYPRIILFDFYYETWHDHKYSNPLEREQQWTRQQQQQQQHRRDESQIRRETHQGVFPNFSGPIISRIGSSLSLSDNITMNLNPHLEPAAQLQSESESESTSSQFTHHQNNSCRILTPQELQAKIRCDEALREIEMYLSTSLQAATRSLDSRNQTILHKCMSFDSKQTRALTSWCLKQEIPIYAKDVKGNTALHLACDNGLSSSVDIILNHFRRILLPPPHRAERAEGDHPKNKSSLIEERLCWNYNDGDGVQSKAINRERGQIKGAENRETLFINGYQYFNSGSKSSFDSDKSADGSILLSTTLEEEDEKKKGPSFTKWKSNWTSTYYRFYKNMNPVKMKSHHGNTSLYLAALKGNDSVVMSLLAFITDYNNYTYIDSQPQQQQHQQKRIPIDLTEYGDQEGFSPLHAAVIKGSLSTVKILLQHRAVNAREEVLRLNRHHQTSFHLAIRNGNLKIFHYLLTRLLDKYSLSDCDFATFALLEKNPSLDDDRKLNDTIHKNNMNSYSISIPDEKDEDLFFLQTLIQETIFEVKTIPAIKEYLKAIAHQYGLKLEDKKAMRKKNYNNNYNSKNKNKNYHDRKHKGRSFNAYK